jgi:hypothetical protein
VLEAHGGLSGVRKYAIFRHLQRICISANAGVAARLSHFKEASSLTSSIQCIWPTEVWTVLRAERAWLSKQPIPSVSVCLQGDLVCSSRRHIRVSRVPQGVRALVGLHEVSIPAFEALPGLPSVHLSTLQKRTLCSPRGWPMQAAQRATSTAGTEMLVFL